jgi:hypothetical protein
VKIKHKQTKIEEVRVQLQELEGKKNKKQEEKKQEASEPEVG